MNIIEKKSVKITGGFWKRKQELNRKVTINAVWDRFSDTGRIGAFKFDWKEGMENKPHYFWDSDVAKWMEGAAYLIAQEYDAELDKKIEMLVDLIEKNQCEDGYFNIYFTVCEPDARFTKRWCHELYCAGHLIEAAVAYYEACGKRKFLDLMIKYVDLIYRVFVTEGSAKFKTPGHEEIEIALIKLYKVTGDKKHLDLARFFLDNRGIEKEQEPLVSIDQSHMPVREQRTAEGHAVRACYLYTAMADMAKEIGDNELFEACKAIYGDIVNHKMYITGGIGSTHVGETFTIPFDLPNVSAYNETCASISMMFFSKSMLALENNSLYADIIEREMYNGMLSGLSLDGKAFFYENPLEINLKNYVRHVSTTTGDRYPIKQRVEVFGCSCCPPNLNRLLPLIGDYIYGYEDRTVYVNQFIESEMSFGNMSVKQTTEYPNNGVVKLEFDGVDTAMIRLPSWCTEFDIDCVYELENGYIKIASPRNITVNFKMRVRFVKSSSDVWENSGRTAVCYGPIVYCAESIDNVENLHSLIVNNNPDAKIEYNEEIGLNTLEINGYRELPNDSLYNEDEDILESTRLRLIPYSCFANRGDASMLVWLRRQ